MFHQSTTRNQRAKSTKTRSILQVSVLLAVVVWLLYQTKHSYDRKAEYAENDNNRLSQGNSDINFGRKASAGSQNGITIYPQPENSDEANETRESSVDQADSLAGHTEEKAEEVIQESDESQEETPTADKEEPHQEQQENGDYSVNDEGMQEDLRLPFELDINEGNGHPKQDPVDQNFTSTEENDSDTEVKTSEEATFSSSISTETVANAEEGSETDKDHVDKEAHVTEELSSSSGSDDQSNVDISSDPDIHKGETAEAQADSGSDTEITSNSTAEETPDISNAEVVHENLNQPDFTSEISVVAPKTEENESEEGSTSQSETSDTNSSEAAASGTTFNGDSTNNPKSAEESNVVMQDSNGVPGHEESESQAGSSSEGQATVEISSDSVNNVTTSEGENTSSISSEENGTVMSDNSGVPKEEVKFQVDELNSETRPNDELLEKSHVDEQTEAAAVNAAEEQKIMNSGEEIANSSLSEKEHVEEPVNVGEESVEGVQSEGSNSIEEAKPEKSDDVVADSSQNNEQISSEITGNKEPVTSHGDSDLKVENTSNGSPEDTTTEPMSNDATAYDSGSKIKLASSNETAENEQELRTDTEKSSEI